MKKRKKRKIRPLTHKELIILGVISIVMIMMLVIFRSRPSFYNVIVYNESNEEIRSHYYHDLKQAQSAYLEEINKDAYNVKIEKDDKIYEIRYGIVNFNTKQCEANTTFYYDEDNKVSERRGYTNGCYGADAAYLGTSSDGKYIKFKLSGAVGWVPFEDVTIHNFFDQQDVKSNNYYEIKDQKITHRGTTNITSENQNISVDIGNIEGTFNAPFYYSYDGQYFYENFAEMIDDYRGNTYEHAINANEPHINYYQYVSHRSKTNYTKEEIDSYFENVLGYNGKMKSINDTNTHSQLYQEGQSFITNQNKYGVNAIMMLSLAINESAYGQSEIAFSKNNLFGHAAYDDSPGESANQYKNVSDSIKVHASNFLSQGYLNPCDQSEDGTYYETCEYRAGNRYNGGYFGDKNSGLNVRYASDPYWGEKAAAYYRSFDESMGNKDKDAYKILKLNSSRVPVYSEPNRDSEILYRSVNTVPTYVNVIKKVKGEVVNEQDDWYEIQSDGIIKDGKLLNEDGVYNFKTSIGYINASYQ